MANYVQYSLCIEGKGMPEPCIEVLMASEEGRQISNGEMDVFPKALLGVADILNSKLDAPEYVTQKFWRTSVWDGKRNIEGGYQYRLMSRFRDPQTTYLQVFLVWICQFSVSDMVLGTSFEEGDISPTILLSLKNRLVEVTLCGAEYPPVLGESPLDPAFLSSEIDWEKGWGQGELVLSGKKMSFYHLAWDEIIKD